MASDPMTKKQPLKAIAGVFGVLCHAIDKFY